MLAGNGDRAPQVWSVIPHFVQIGEQGFAFVSYRGDKTHQRTRIPFLYLLRRLIEAHGNIQYLLVFRDITPSLMFQQCQRIAERPVGCPHAVGTTDNLTSLLIFLGQAVQLMTIQQICRLSHTRQTQ
ncbi:hypothetical protein D3C75_889490 [compost metagenome]